MRFENSRTMIRRNEISLPALRGGWQERVISRGQFSVRRLARVLFLTLAIFCLPVCATEQPSKPLLLRSPTISRKQIAFSYAGYIWTTDRDGNNLRRLTNEGHEERPFFSPDGSLIAYTGCYEGTRSVFLISAAGGTPRRLTYHPGDIDAAGWTPSGHDVLFTSTRLGYAPRVDENTQLFTVPVTGGFATAVPLKRSSEGSYSPDGARIAYVPNVQWTAVPEGDWRTSMMDTWKHYRGGQTKPIWIARLSDSSVIDKIPRENSNDFNPMWVGNKVYFLSDRNGPVNLFSYDLTSKQVTQIIYESDGWDIKSASASADAIVYEQMGSLHVLDLKSGKARFLDIRPDFVSPATQPHLLKIPPQQISEAALSPNGTQVAFGARGEILTLSIETGSSRDLTKTTAAVERGPAWSPDGASIAYLSDASGDYALHVRNPDGSGEVRQFTLGSPPSYYYSLRWSPDSTKIGYTDKKLNYWYLDLKEKTSVLVATDNFVPQKDPLQFAWSPDSRWIAYTKQLPSHVHAVYLYSLDRKKSFQITDGMSDVLHVAFDRSGRYLYFTASTDIFSVSEDWSNIRRPVERHVYAVTLRNSDPPPMESTLRPRQQDNGNAPNSFVETELRIDIEGIGRRITALTTSPGNYVNLHAGAPGTILLVEAPKSASSNQVVEPEDKKLKLVSLDVISQKSTEIVDSATLFSFSDDGSKALFSRQNQWFVVGTTHSQPDTYAHGENKELKLDSLQVYIDPRAEWRHMFEQILRNESEFFYDPGLHGLDLTSLRDRYEPFLDNLSNREELNYLLEDMLGEMACGHMFLRSGRYPEPTAVKTGLLGADYIIKNNRYQISRIYEGDPWNPSAHAPLALPGLNVKAGDYVLAVNGRNVSPPTDIYSFFEETAGKTISLRIGPNPDGTSAREITVAPIDDETLLRNHAWIEANRHKVDELSGGRIAYVYLSDVTSVGYEEFNRYYFAQSDKEAVIIDDRFNHGGWVAEYIVNYLSRPLMGYWHQRDRNDLTIPLEGIFGPKVMLINEMAGSGGDMLPWFFRRLGLGPLIGKRTWGGLVSTSFGPDDLLDGTNVSTPNQAFYNPDGAWDIENHGVAPDIDVNDSSKVGDDPQLEKAVSVALDLLQKTRHPTPHGHPAFPNYHQSDSLGSLASPRRDVTASRQN